MLAEDEASAGNFVETAGSKEICDEGVIGEVKVEARDAEEL